MAPAFVHPGILVTLPMLLRIRQEVHSQTEPTYSAFLAANASHFGALNYTAHPHAIVECGAFSNPDVGCSDEKNDADAAYTHALLWFIKQDDKHAHKAIQIMDAWARTVKNHTNLNAPLQSAWI
eukprot:g739.t1